MCRSSSETADGKPLRCDKCNEPQNRRDRQNLANAVKREEAVVATEPKETPVVTEPESLASFVTKDVQAMGLEDVDAEVITETISSMLAEPEVARQLAASVRETRENAESGKAWILDGKEDTPENLAAGLAERQQEILLVGTVIAERAQAIHGVDIEEARREWQERVPVVKAKYDAASAEAKIAEEAFINRRLELIEKYDSVIYEYEEKITPEEQEEIEALRLDKNAKLDAKEEARENLRKVFTGEDKETAAVMDRIAAGNKQAIAEVRPVGNIPVEFDEKIRGGEAGEVFRSSVSGTFPDDWVKKSNELGTLSIIRTSDKNGRVHYSPVKNNLTPYSYTMTGQPDERDDRFEGWRPRLDENGNPTGKWEGLKRDVLMMEPDPRTFKKYNKNGTPKGTGWKKGNAVQDGRTVPIWVRDNETDKQSVTKLSDTSAKITFNMSAGKREMTQDIQHEFSHRVEDANPHITMLEEGFIASRTTGADGRRDPLTRYEANPSEKVRSDNFVLPYIGKEYEDVSMREVLSMGTESVFGGAHGGLVGIGSQKSDLEMRNWILGMYATA